MTKQTKHRLGAPPIKMKDLADLAGVSISTVSRSLTNHHSIPEATRQAIQELAAKHGYVVNNSARSLRQKQTRTIALALPLERAGKNCPRDVAVVGFDDSELAVQARPPLTTIRQDVAGIAFEIVRLLFKRLEGVGTDSVAVPVELVVRESAP